MAKGVTRTASGPASAVLESVADAKRRTLRLPEDERWLRSAVGERLPRGFDGDLAALLQRMAERENVYRVRRGRYVVAPRGTFSVKQAASTELLVDLVLAAQGDYFLSYLSALIAHRLTDVHSPTTFAAIRQSSVFGETHLALPGLELQIVRLTDRRWPVGAESEHGELERVRALPDTKEFVWRATAERALVDALSRPDLSAGLETVVSCWAAAMTRGSLNWDVVSAIARRLGDSSARRAAFVLDLLGLDDVVSRNFPDLHGRGRAVLLDRSNSYRVAKPTRDSRTGVIVNVPLDHLRGWISAVGLG